MTLSIARENSGRCGKVRFLPGDPLVFDRDETRVEGAKRECKQGEEHGLSGTGDEEAGK